MEVEDVGEGRGSFQVSVDYGDNGELDLDYGDLMAEAEQEPETTPLHHATAAYEDSPPLRSRHTPQPSSKPRSKDAVAPKEHRPILSWEKWVQEANPDEGKDAQVKEDTVRSSCHQDRPSQRESSRQRESSASRQREGATVRPREDRRHAESRPRDSSRRRQYSPERRQPAARLRPDDRHVMIVPKVVDINVGRRTRTDRPVHLSRPRSRSPIRSTVHRSPLRSRTVHPAAYDRSQDPEASRHALHAPDRRNPEPIWPELHAPPSGRKVETFVRPHLDRAPIRTPEFAWEERQYERDAYAAHAAPAEYDYRHRQPEYHKPAERDATYRAPLYREPAYEEGGYAAAQSRNAGYRLPSYEYAEPEYRDYHGSRPAEPLHDPYLHADASWNAPRYSDPHHNAYASARPISDDRWHDRDHRQLPARGSPRAARAERGQVDFSRNTLYPESRHDREHGFLPARDQPRHQAPRLAHEYAQPPARSHRSGQHLAPRDDRNAARSAPRYADQSDPGLSRARSPYAPRQPRPMSSGRRSYPSGRSPGSRGPSPIRDTRRHPEPSRRSHQETNRPSGRARRSAERAGPKGREALELTSRSFALEAATKQAAPEAAEPGQLDLADLPPPPAVTTGHKSRATASEAVKPSRASVVARPNAAPELLTDKQEAGDSSPELNVHQGFLSAAAPSLGERPFQRGQRAQQPATLADEPTSRAGDADAKGQEAPQQSSRDHRPEVNKGKEAGRDPAGLKAKLDRDRSGSAKDLAAQDEAGSRQQEASDRKTKADGDRREGAAFTQDKHKGSSLRESKPDKAEKLRDKASSGCKDAVKAGSDSRTAATKATKPKESSSKDRAASERKTDDKKSVCSPSKAGNANQKAERASGRDNSRREDVVSKQAGQKRRSRSREAGRSPKRKASSPVVRKSGKEADRHGGKSDRVEQQQLPPPPARPSSAYSNDNLPPPPARLDGERASNKVPGGRDQALPPPPPKPHSQDKQTTSSTVGTAGPARVEDNKKLARVEDTKKPASSKEIKPASKPSADAAAKPSRHTETAKAFDSRPKRESGPGRDSGKTNDKGHLVARDSKRAEEKPANGRTGQKRARSRSPQKAVGASKGVNGSKRQAKSPDSQRADAKQRIALNGKAGDKPKDSDSESRREWVYEDKGKTHGPLSKQRMKEIWSKIKGESKSKALDYLRLSVWQDGSKYKKQQMQDVLNV